MADSFRYNGFRGNRFPLYPVIYIFFCFLQMKKRKTLHLKGIGKQPQPF